MSASTRTLVLGIGNTLLSDHGAGVHALRRVERLLGRVSGVEYFDGSTSSQSLQTTLGDYHRWVVLDAGQLERTPGTIETFEGPDMDTFLGRDGRGAHESDLARLLEVARSHGTLPARRALVAIQPECVNLGSRTSGRVRAVLDEAAAAAIGFICHWDVEAEACA
jgi:hydrogenase maturation protease